MGQCVLGGRKTKKKKTMHSSHRLACQALGNHTSGKYGQFILLANAPKTNATETCRFGCRILLCIQLRSVPNEHQQGGALTRTIRIVQICGRLTIAFLRTARLAGLHSLCPLARSFADVLPNTKHLHKVAAFNRSGVLPAKRKVPTLQSLYLTA